MKLMLPVLTALLLAAPGARAQSDEEVEISVSGFTLAANGAEKPAGVTWGPGKLTVGKPSVGIFSVRGCGYFTASTATQPFEEHSTHGWRVEVTPLKIAKPAVTLRLRWVRALDKGTGVSPVGEDVEVTLEPGQSRPLDTVPIVMAGMKTYDGRPCDTKAASLRLSADFPDFDRRLIGASVWLVEKLPKGKEDSQLQSIRGLPHRPLTFYFDSISNGSKRIDFFGKLIADPERGSIDVTLETVRAVQDPGQKGYQAARWFRSTVQLKPDETVEVALRDPEETADAGIGRTFVLRIQVKQIR
jgi:hypothetical protein